MAPTSHESKPPGIPGRFTHQFGAAEGDFTLTPVTTPTGAGWSLTNSSNLTPPGYYYLVAVDARDVPSEAKIIKVS
jgi:Galactose oxidase-like, Early set domain